ncbi:uncharacterized protein PGTG_10679 [Puccinia graminis f. sp. tritici CRL 75-36-700-3]|uniref:Uncharacterized protein n=2 Tax=Puccinia graminis f. sp. tritici TaxID=56615 RepID=E3KJ26_PUCGT|nr:uncharacterized protein PGTG_10679 [Puccinia graminis f. sp. tritici CRL 75-36-700-3]EFP84301.1 hypothetical protein PGTG_10679 [Puccinia graminis f. sp. tritici CRL 75-36-700-3]
MSTTYESEDDVSNIFNNPPSPSHNNNTYINNPAEHDQHDTSHANIFNQTNHPSDNEVTDERMADADDPIDLLIEELQSLYHLNDHFASIAMKAAKLHAQCPPEERFVRLFYAITSISQSLESVSSKSGSANHAVRDFLKDFIRETARSFVGRTDVEAYTATVDKHSDSLTKSLLRLTIGVADKQTPEFKEKFYPKGFEGGDLNSNSQYDEVIANLVKHVRGQLRDTLLNQILSNKKVQPTDVVPPIEDLINLIIKDLLPRHKRATQAAVSITWRQHIRFSHLQLETVSHYLGHYPKTITQWMLIDQRLDDLRWKSLPFQQKHAEMVLEKDKSLFSQKKNFKDLDHDSIVMPSMQDVENALTRLLLPQPSQSAPPAQT